MSSNERQGFGGALPVSQASFLYQAMTTMSEYDIEMQDQWLKQQREQAEALGGIQKDDKGNIHLIVDDNGVATGGTIANFLNLSFEAANNAGDAIRDDANAAWVQFGSSLGGLGLSAVALKATSDSALDNQLKDAQALQREINSPADNELVQKNLDPESEEGKLQAKIERKLKDWASGDKSLLGNYQIDAEGKPVDAETARINAQAAKQARVSQHKAAIAKNLSDYIDHLQNLQAQGSNRFNSATNTISQVTGAAASGGSAVYNGQKASDQQHAQEKAALADVQKTNLQQQIGYGTDAKQKADAFFQDAMATSAGYGQMVNTHA